MAKQKTCLDCAYCLIASGKWREYSCTNPDHPEPDLEDLTPCKDFLAPSQTEPEAKGHADLLKMFLSTSGHWFTTDLRDAVRAGIDALTKGQ